MNFQFYRPFTIYPVHCTAGLTKSIYQILPLALFVVFLFGCTSMEGAYKDALERNRLSVFLKFQKDFADSPHSTEVETRIEELRFENAKKVKSISAYEVYLKYFPDGRYAKQAKQTLENLVFQKARKSKSIKASKKYLQKYPAGEFTAEVKCHIDNLQFKSANIANTIKAYMDFIKSYPESNHLQKAEHCLDTVLKKASYFEIQKVLKKFKGDKLRNKLQAELNKFSIQEAGGKIGLIVWHGTENTQVQGKLTVNALLTPKFKHDGTNFTQQIWKKSTTNYFSSSMTNSMFGFSIKYPTLEGRKLYLIPSLKTDTLTCTEAIFKNELYNPGRTLSWQSRKQSSMDGTYTRLDSKLPVFGIMLRGQKITVGLEPKLSINHDHDNVFTLSGSGISMVLKNSRINISTTQLVKTPVIISGKVRFPMGQWTPFINGIDVNGGGALFTPTRITLTPGTKFAVKLKR